MTTPLEDTGRAAVALIRASMLGDDQGRDIILGCTPLRDLSDVLSGMALEALLVHARMLAQVCGEPEGAVEAAVERQLTGFLLELPQT